jgi:hypothetical protein
MTTDRIPDADHVVRYVKPTAVEADGSINGSEFRLRPSRPDDIGVSVNWLECFADKTKAERLGEVRRLVRLALRRAGRFAELNVGRTRKHLDIELASLQFVKDPLAADDRYLADPSHSLMIGLPPGDTPEAELIGDMIAECIVATHPAIAD